MKARKSLIFNSMLMFCLLHILLHNLPKAVNARAILQSISTFTSGTELPRKTKPFTFSISFPSIVICCCDEVRTFHSPLLIFIPHSVQASCNCDVSSCNFCIIGIFNNKSAFFIVHGEALEKASDFIEDEFQKYVKGVGDSRQPSEGQSER